MVLTITNHSKYTGYARCTLHAVCIVIQLAAFPLSVA